jgi:hypothetical protein
VSHLLLNLKISGRAQTFHNEIDLLGPSGVNGQTRMRSHPHRRQMADTSPNKLNAAIEINEPTRLLRVMHDGDDNGTKEFN